MTDSDNGAASASQNADWHNEPSTWSGAYAVAIEYYIWAIVAAISFYYAVRGMDLFYVGSRDPIEMAFFAIQFASGQTAPFTLALIALLFPILFRMIFGQAPIQFLRAQFRISAANRHESRQISSEVRAVSYFETLDPRQTLCFLAERSNSLARGIYARAGVYLLVGVVIAFGGIAAVWNRYGSLKISGDMIQNLFVFVPNIGLFIFIEFIAFFFLRQYRSAMDDFRYYDAVARSRQESFVVLKMFRESKDVVPTKDVLTSMQIYSTAGRIISGETTDIIESRKMQRDELVFVENVAYAVAQYQRDNGNKKEKKDKE